MITVKPLYSGHALQRTPLYSGHHFWEPIANFSSKFTSLQRTPLNSGHLFREPMVSAIERFHCILLGKFSSGEIICRAKFCHFLKIRYFCPTKFCPIRQIFPCIDVKYANFVFSVKVGNQGIPRIYNETLQLFKGQDQILPCSILLNDANE